MRDTNLSYLPVWQWVLKSTSQILCFCPNWDHISARMNYEERDPSCGTRAVPAGQGNQPHNKIKGNI